MDITPASSSSAAVAAAPPLQLFFCYWPATRLVGAWSPSGADDAALAALVEGDTGGGADCAVLAQLADPPYEFGSGSTPGRPYMWGLGWHVYAHAPAAHLLP